MNILQGIYLKVAAAILAIGGTIASAYFKGKSTGKDEVEVTETKKALKRAVEANEVDNEVKEIPADKLSDELDEWMRDNP